jgi:formate--tetrahydrofolate ligase
MVGFGMPVVVSINRFTSDTDNELEALKNAAQNSGAVAVTLTEVHAKGGEGGEQLAKAVVAAVHDHVANGRPFTPLFTQETPVLEKMESIAKRMYKADGVDISPSAMKQIDKLQAWGYGHLPVCMAKTQYSFSHDPGKLGAPVGFRIPVREFRLNAGAGFIVAVLGNMMTMPGLPKRPAALDMDMDENGQLTGVFG